MKWEQELEHLDARALHLVRARNRSRELRLAEGMQRLQRVEDVDPARVARLDLAPVELLQQPGYPPELRRSPFHLCEDLILGQRARELHELDDRHSFLLATRFSTWSICARAVRRDTHRSIIGRCSQLTAPILPAELRC